jgi:transposase
MQVVYHKVAGLDVHKKTIVACVRVITNKGKTVEETRTFGTMTRDLLKMLEWFRACQVTHVAMESTGVFWKPVWHILEGHVELLLANAHELKRVPGRKTDASDAAWIAQLMQCGLLRSSFVPSQEQRELRDLTRHRVQLTGELTRTINRIHKVLEDANIKLGSVATDIMGVSGRTMLAALLRGDSTPAEMAELSKGRLRGKIPELKLALEGHVTDHHRFMLERLLNQVEHLENEIAEFDARIDEALRPFLTEDQFRRLDVIPGLNRRTIENVIAEIGTDMSQFPTADHLASWAGMCPGNEESAGKRKRQRTTNGNNWLRRALSEAAWAAKNAKQSYLSAQYRRIIARRGKKRAIIAVGHSLLEIIYHVLRDNVEYQDLGADYFNKLAPERLRRHLVKRLEELGYNVQLTRATAA